MTELVPKSVVVGISAQTLSRNRLVTIGLTVFVAFFMFAMRGWGALFMVPFVFAIWLAQMRTAGASIEFTPQTVHVRAIMRWARISTESVTDIVLSPRPGMAYVIANDGGSAQVPLSAIALEVSQERRVRLHDLGMLERMYRGTDIRISGENRTRTLGANRSSAAVKFRWIRIGRREWLVFVGILAYGVLCFFIPSPS